MGLMLTTQTLWSKASRRRTSPLFWLWLLTGLLAGLPLPAQVTIIVDDIPANTPHDATLFLVGDFNDWNPGDAAYRFSRLPDSTYQITLMGAPDSFDYKVTRGNWSSVEGRPNGQARPNRTFLRREGGTARIEIATWEDLAGGVISWYTFLLLFSAGQGLLLILAIAGIQDNNRRANRLLFVLLGLTSFALIGRVSLYDRDLFTLFPKLFLAPEMILFLYAPIFYFYIQELLKFEDSLRLRRWMHFIPAGLHLLSYTPVLVRDDAEFRLMVIHGEIHTYVAIAGGFALLFNAFYWYRVWRILHSYDEKSSSTQSFEHNFQYLNGVMVLQGIVLAIWLFAYLIEALGLALPFPSTYIRERATDTAWFAFSFTSFLMGYFAMNHPEIFKLPKVVEKYKGSQLPDDELSTYKGRLVRVMEQDKAFMNPELTLSELSALVKTNTHTLSRVINEGFGRSFYDYVNAYRVQEFTRLMLSEAGKQETFLSLALQVGFNSKTTFNRAFKKITGTTPRAYLKEQQEAAETAVVAEPMRD
ncbi:MAG: helix-turn-helix domain-containing protein [Bacteroidetes bacterium]|nr:MAG: helix-turn-helix domain-containing protein [Bacteroidota bacterium]